MTHTYDWSKLDAGWEERAGELRYYEGNGTVYPFGVAWLENNSRYLRELDPRWHELHDQARAQLAKCRIRDTEPAPPNCDHDWNDSRTVCMRCRKTVGDLQREQEAPVMVCRPDVSTVEGQASVERELNAIQSQFTVSLPPATVREVQRIATEQVRSLADSINASEPPDPRDLPIGPLVRLFGVPWKLGPLATWTLVNISCQDGRLTVVMRRGRGECLIETGVDDEGIWERLGLKVVELDKAKVKAKEKSDV